MILQFGGPIIALSSVRCSLVFGAQKCYRTSVRDMVVPGFFVVCMFVYLILLTP